MRAHMIGCEAEALVQHQAEQALRRRVALLGSAAVPVVRQRIILRHAASVLVHESEIGLRAGIAALG
jgi:hypothetical protein